MRVTLDDLLEPVDVELLGHEYRLRELTRQVAQRWRKLQPEIDRLQESPGSVDPEKTAELLIATVDLILEPHGDAPPAKKLLGDRWRNGEISLQRLSAIAGRLNEIQEERANPTSTGGTDG